MNSFISKGLAQICERWINVTLEELPRGYCLTLYPISSTADIYPMCCLGQQEKVLFFCDHLQKYSFTPSVKPVAIQHCRDPPLHQQHHCLHHSCTVLFHTEERDIQHSPCIKKTPYYTINCIIHIHVLWHVLCTVSKLINCITSHHIVRNQSSDIISHLHN